MRVGADGRIEAVGLAEQVPPGDARVVDLGNALIVPGLVNLHGHPELTLLRGRLEDLEFTRWIEKLTELKYDVLAPEAIRASTWLGVAEAIAAGVTCMAAPDDAGYLLEAMVQSGLRGRVYREVFGPAPDQAVASLAGLEAKVDEMRPRCNDRVDIGISPHAPYTVSDRLFEMLTDYACTTGLPVCIHVAESEAEERFVRDGTGTFAERLLARGIDVKPQNMSPIAKLAEVDILAARPLLVHCVRVDAWDVAAIADHGASIAHCPVSNAKLGHGVAPLPDFMKAGIAVGLGSDSVASNNRVDVLGEARFAALQQRSHRREAELMSPEELLSLATLEGARALGLDDKVGSLEPGKDADFIAVKLGAPHLTPVGDPVAALFHSAGVGDVALSVVAGQVLYRDGELVTLDLPALAGAAQESMPADPE
jgi:5-methylthioadenosine/S-adenosylhomocysteine deaminase